MKTLHIFTFLAAVSLGLKAQQRFPEIVFSDRFDVDSGKWEIRSDATALYLIQGGSYMLRRLDKNEGAVLYSPSLPCDPYRLDAALKVEAAGNAMRYAGLAFMMQDDNAGGFLLEVNTKKQYRIRQVVQGSFRLLSGTLENQGWVNGDLSPAGALNRLSLVYSDKSYELYINERLIRTFVEPAYRLGRFGFVVGPSATAHADEITVSASAGCLQGSAAPADTVSAQSPDSLTMIRRLRDEVSRLQTELRTLRDSIRSKDAQE